jgi:hypothetical protein
VGRRLTGPDVPHLDERAADAYGQMIYRLLDIPPNGADDHGPLPHRIPLGDDAARELWALEARLERRMAEDGDLFGIRDWAAKMCGQVVRIAGLLHVVGDEISSAISGGTMAAAVAIGEALSAHALVVLGTAADPRVALMRYVLDKIASLPAEDRTVRELHRVCQGKAEIGNVDDLHNVLDDLTERGLIRVLTVRPSGPGRPPAPRIVLRPENTHDRIDKRPRHIGQEDDSVNSVNLSMDPLDILRGVA